MDAADAETLLEEAIAATDNYESKLRLADLGTRTGHITMRQLVGFSAFLPTGGQSSAERLVDGHDAAGFSCSNLAFEGGVGPLFGAVRATFLRPIPLANK